MKEKSVERMLKRKIEAAIPGAKCLKFISPGNSGMPDRIIMLPGGVIIFAETKRPGEVPRPLQLFVHSQLRKMGFIVAGCVDSPEAVRRTVALCISVAGVTAWLHNSGRLAEAERVIREHGV